MIDVRFLPLAVTLEVWTYRWVSTGHCLTHLSGQGMTGLPQSHYNLKIRYNKAHILMYVYVCMYIHMGDMYVLIHVYVYGEMCV